MKYPLFITQHGELRRESNALIFSGELVKRPIPLAQINEIHCLARVSLTSGAIDLLSEKGIPVHFYTTRGDYKGPFINDASPRGKLHLSQAEHYLNPEKRLYLAKEIVEGIQNTMAFVLSRWGVNPVKLNSVTVDGESVEEIMGKEAELWSHFYRYFGEAIEVDDFRRTRRPPEDEVNALISYANAVTYGLAFSSSVKAGLDPSIGFLHAVNDRRHSLPLDLADIFKPLYVFSTVKAMLKTNGLKSSDFSKKGKAVYLSREGKRKLLSALTDTLRRTVYYKPWKRSMSYRFMMDYEARRLKRHLLGRGKYKAFRPWWR
ncbi:CRISPR-associated endonuclease Cas1 [Thermococcus indicus]|uniref:CRISPR-associated endonuclease Cas1 n=2 Tax=Thermococcus indicus TaxID=2586643 RepID=A0A4Y5SP12_9EURY|nr:CRISPR-associated endonuclease Cas1 [Thermococcus indicus]